MKYSSKKILLFKNWICVLLFLKGHDQSEDLSGIPGYFPEGYSSGALYESTSGHYKIL
jgi:hypothetical protein